MRQSSTSICIFTAVSLLVAACGGESTPEAQSADNQVPPAEQPTTETTPAMEAAASSAPAAAAASAPDTANQEATAAPKPEPLTDAQIAMITDSANTAEVDQAKAALPKLKDAKVRKFANMMVQHHGEAKTKQAKLKIDKQESEPGKMLTADSSKTLEQLKQAKAGADYDLLYISSQVDGHRKVLDAIDNQLLPNVQSAELKAYIQEIRPKVESHLQQAVELQSSLQTGASPASTGTTSTGSTTKSGATTGTGTGTSGSSSATTGTSGTTGTGSSKSTTGASGTTGAGTGSTK